MSYPPITPAARNAYHALLKAEENHTEISDHLTPMLDTLIASFNFTGEEGKIVTKDAHSYLLAEKDFNVYHKACKALFAEQGYIVPKDHSPVLEAYSKKIEAENAFIEETLYLTPAKYLPAIKKGLHILAHRAKYIEVTKGFFLACEWHGI